MALLEEVPIVVARRPAPLPGRDDGGLAGCPQGLEQAFLSIECLVGDQRVRLDLRQQVIGADQVVGFAAGQENVGRVAERIDAGVDLGAQSAARTPDGLIRVAFFWAPALC